MKVIDTPLPDTMLIELQVHADRRGSFRETFNRATMAGLGIDHEFVQDNESRSAASGTIRGLHLQVGPHAQGKLVRVLKGSILDVVVDIRVGSPTRARHATVTLEGSDDLVFWIPPGFAHGFCTLEPDTIVAYKTTRLRAPGAERTIRFDDPELAIAWPVDSHAAILSPRDAAAPLLTDIEGELG